MSALSMYGNRRGLVAPQNTFLDKIIRRCNSQHSNFFLANSNIYNYPIIYSSEGFCKMSGYSKTEVIHQQATCNFMHGDGTTSEMKDRFKGAIEMLHYEQIEVLFYKKNKNELWLMVQVSPIRNEKDEINLFLVTFKNITALKTSTNDEDSSKDSSKFARLARTVTKNRSLLQHMSTSSTSLSKVGIGVAVDSKSISDYIKYDVESCGTQTKEMISEKLPFYRQEAPKTPPHIILHYLNFKAVWDWIILILTGYTAVMVPYNAAFKSRNMDDIVFLVVDSIVDVVFFIDIVFNFHTTFVGPNGEVISDPNVIRINYLKGWFVIDLLSCLPYDVFNAFQPETTQSAISSLFSALKVVRLLRIGRVTRKLDQYLEYMAVSLILMIFGFVLLAHWLACIWFSIGHADLQNKVFYGWIPRLSNDTMHYRNWKNITNIQDNLPPKSLVYITSLYYTLSLITSIGFGNVSANTFGEKLVSVVFMLIGAFGYATIFGKITTIFQQMNSTRARYHEMMSNVKDFIKTHSVPRDLAERVIDYISSSWAITKGIDTGKVLNYCPKDMKADLCIHLNRMVFNKHTAFRLASDGCLRSLAINFQTIHTAPGDLIFHQGESIDQLCFVVSGSLEVIQDDEIVAILGQGDIFGEAFWKDPNKLSHSTATVRALTYCDLHCIKRDCLLHILDFYNAFGNSFSRNLVLTYDLKHRIIFRKLSDVKREKELEEKRKNDNLFEDLDPNHPVRKMISKLRKGLHSTDQTNITTDNSLEPIANSNDRKSSYDSLANKWTSLMNKDKVGPETLLKLPQQDSETSNCVSKVSPTPDQSKQRQPSKMLWQRLKHPEPITEVEEVSPLPDKNFEEELISIKSAENAEENINNEEITKLLNAMQHRFSMEISSLHDHMLLIINRLDDLCSQVKSQKDSGLMDMEITSPMYANSNSSSGESQRLVTKYSFKKTFQRRKSIFKNLFSSSKSTSEPEPCKGNDIKYKRRLFSHNRHNMFKPQIIDQYYSQTTDNDVDNIDDEDSSLSPLPIKPIKDLNEINFSSFKSSVPSSPVEEDTGSKYSESYSHSNSDVWQRRSFNIHNQVGNCPQKSSFATDKLSFRKIFNKPRSLSKLKTPKYVTTRDI